MSCWVVGVSADEISNRSDDALCRKENQKMKGLWWFRFRWVPVIRRYLLRRSFLVERRGVFRDTCFLCVEVQTRVFPLFWVDVNTWAGKRVLWTWGSEVPFGW